MERTAQSIIVMRDLSQFSKVYLVPLADFHEGARDADHEVSDGYIRWIAERDNAFTILNGDMMNCAWKDSTPELFEDLTTPDAAYTRLVERLSPIKDKILMITRGGHEEAIFRKVGTDFMARLSHALRPDGVPETDHRQDVPYRPDGGMVGMKLTLYGKPLYFFSYAVHGWGGARTIGAKVKKTEDLALVADVDCYILSHDHTQNVHRLNIHRPPRGGRITMGRPIYEEVDRKILINTGGFVRYEGYIRRKGYSPQDIGTPRIRMEIKHRIVDGQTRYYKDLHASI